MLYEAKCCCGECSIAVTDEPAWNGVCHCDNCKRRSGSAFVWMCYFKDDAVLPAQGPLSVYKISTVGRQERWFCRLCGTTLFLKVSAFPGLDWIAGFTGISGGCFTGSNFAGRPDTTISDEKRCDWIGLPEEWHRSLEILDEKFSSRLKAD